MKKAANGDKVLTGIQMAKTEFSDDCHCSLFHAVKQICKIAVEIVVHLEGTDFGVSEQYAAGAAEYIDKAAVFQWEQSIQNVEDGAFVAHP